MGVRTHPFRGPRMVEDFTAGITPDYPMQTMLAVFAPREGRPGEPYVEPELVIDHIRATPAS